MTQEEKVVKQSCPMCGGTSFISGDFTPMRLSFRAYRPASLFSGLRGGYEMRGKQCTTCGNIQLFATVRSSEGS